MNPKETKNINIQDLENQLNELAQTWEKSREMAEICLELGKAYAEQNQLDLAKVNFQKIIDWDEADFVGKAYHQLGNLAFRENEFDSALSYYQKAIENFEKNQQINEIGTSYNMLGAVYTQQKKSKEALNYFEKSIEAHTQTENYLELGKSYHNLALFLQSAMIVKNQRIYWENSLEKAQNLMSIAFIEHHLGLWLYREQIYEKAFASFEKARQTKESYQLNYELGVDYYYLGSLFEQKGNHTQAITYHKVALQKMLANEEYDYIGVTIYFLQHSLADIKQVEEKIEIQELFQKAENQGISLESQSEEETIAKYAEGEEEIKNLDFSETLEEVVKHESGKSLDETYQILKAGLPETAGKYAETAFDLLEKLQSNYKNAWFSKKSKKQVFEDKKSEILSILADYPDLTEWLEQIKKFD